MWVVEFWSNSHEIWLELLSTQCATREEVDVQLVECIFEDPSYKYRILEVKD
jgi:hypothetical protein